MSHFSKGDPLKRPIIRVGKWPLKNTLLDSGWKFYSDAESHTISQVSAPMYKMTGESAGRQIWHFEETSENFEDEKFYFSADENPNSADKIFRYAMLKKWKGKTPDKNLIPTTAYDAAVKGLHFYQMLQCDDGHWAGDYGGPMFLMPGLICTLYITKAPFPDANKKAMVLYLKNHQQIDGGWGTHIECASTMFGTILSYVALRLLGINADEKFMKDARTFISKHGGALYAPR